MLAKTLQDMFVLNLPVLEKIVRPIVVYFAIVVLLRIFGKRELAQLNPFDLVVLLSVSNTVQNAIIGDDNSVTGGIAGRAEPVRGELFRGAVPVPAPAAGPDAGRVADHLDLPRAGSEGRAGQRIAYRVRTGGGGAPAGI